MVEQSDLMSSIKYRWLGKLTLTQWVRSLQGLEEGAWFTRDDLVPFAAMCWASLDKATRMLVTVCWDFLVKNGRKRKPRKREACD
jgi:hypothetical protein